jgi:hypothetical protein
MFAAAYFAATANAPTEFIGCIGVPIEQSHSNNKQSDVESANGPAPANSIEHRPVANQNGRIVEKRLYPIDL